MACSVLFIVDIPTLTSGRDNSHFFKTSLSGEKLYRAMTYSDPSNKPLFIWVKLVSIPFEARVLEYSAGRSSLTSDLSGKTFWSLFRRRYHLRPDSEDVLEDRLEAAVNGVVVQIITPLWHFQKYGVS